MSLTSPSHNSQQLLSDLKLQEQTTSLVVTSFSSRLAPVSLWNVLAMVISSGICQQMAQIYKKFQQTVVIVFTSHQTTAGKHKHSNLTPFHQS